MPDSLDNRDDLFENFFLNPNPVFFAVPTVSLQARPLTAAFSCVINIVQALFSAVVVFAVWILDNGKRIAA